MIQIVIFKSPRYIFDVAMKQRHEKECVTVETVFGAQKKILVMDY